MQCQSRKQHFGFDTSPCILQRLVQLFILKYIKCLNILQKASMYCKIIVVFYGYKFGNYGFKSNLQYPSKALTPGIQFQLFCSIPATHCQLPTVIPPKLRSNQIHDSMDIFTFRGCKKKNSSTSVLIGSFFFANSESFINYVTGLQSLRRVSTLGYSLSTDTFSYHCQFVQHINGQRYQHHAPPKQCYSQLKLS